MIKSPIQILQNNTTVKIMILSRYRSIFGLRYSSWHYIPSLTVPNRPWDNGEKRWWTVRDYIVSRWWTECNHGPRRPENGIGTVTGQNQREMFLSCRFTIRPRFFTGGPFSDANIFALLYQLITETKTDSKSPISSLLNLTIRLSNRKLFTFEN